MDDVDLDNQPEEEQKDRTDSEYDDEIDSDYFAASASKNDLAQGLNSARMSNASSGSATFRDTDLSEIDALKTMRI